MMPTDLFWKSIGRQVREVKSILGPRIGTYEAFNVALRSYLEYVVAVGTA